MNGTWVSPLDGHDHSLERLAHDVKNLLGVVIGFTELILRDLDPQAPHREALLEIKKAGEGAAALAARIMETAHSREGT